MSIVSLEGANNVRDLGNIPAYKNKRIKPGLLYRGAKLSSITPADTSLLFNKLNIGCVVDLRTGWEIEKKPDILPDSVEFLRIPFYDNNLVGIEYTTPMKGTQMHGHDLVCDPDHYYRTLTNPLTVGQMCKGVHAIFQRASKGIPVLQHCSGGKDRTGIMTVLLLTILGVSRDDILADYQLTNIARDAGIEKTYARFLYLVDGDEEFAREITRKHGARPENLQAFYEAIDATYGSMDAFVRNQLQLNNQQLDEIRTACTY